MQTFEGTQGIYPLSGCHPVGTELIIRFLSFVARRYMAGVKVIEQDQDALDDLSNF